MWVTISARAEDLLPRKVLRFNNGTTVVAEMATTPDQKSRGLMFRTHLGEGKGMLFVFEIEQPLSFWMKNTIIPLTIGYFDKNKKLIETHDMAPAVGPVREELLERYPSSRAVMYALEVPKGWFAKKKIKPNDTFTIQK